MTRQIFTICALVCALTGLAFGQATMGSTTLAAAVNATDEYVTVASATGISAAGANNVVNTILYVDREAMPVRSLSGTRVRVFRGQSASRQGPHASGATVWLGPPGYFSVSDKIGACTSTAEMVLPIVNIANGNVWHCNSSKWALAKDASGVMRSSINPNSTVSAQAATATLAATDFGKILTNTGAGAAIVLTLPAAATVAGQSIKVQVTVAQTVTLTPVAGTAIYLGGSGVVSKYLLIAGVIGNFVDLYCDGVSFHVVNYSGVVTKEA